MKEGLMEYPCQSAATPTYPSFSNSQVRKKTAMFHNRAVLLTNL